LSISEVRCIAATADSSCFEPKHIMAVPVSLSLDEMESKE